MPEPLHHRPASERMRRLQKLSDTHSSICRYSPVPAMRRAGSRDDDASEREQDAGVSRQPASVEP